MNVNEIAQILKNIPNDLYKLPQYDKLFGNVKMHTFFVILDITLPTKTIAIRVEVYEDMDFSFRIYNRYIIVNHLKVYTKDIVDRIKTYLSILGFNCTSSY